MTVNAEIVVAHYQENISWLNRLQGAVQTVYRKGRGPEKDRLPNIGREADTYLHHIVQRYEELAEMTVFLQGNPFDHVPDIVQQLMRLELTCLFRQFSRHILVEDACGNPSHPGVPVREFHKTLFGNPAPDFLTCRTAACFAVSATTIRSRPKEFYEAARCLTNSHEFGPHAMERLWQQVFHREPESEGIVTASDAGFFSNLRFLILSLRHWTNYPVVVFDLGLLPTQKDWLNEQSGVVILPMPLTDKWIAPILQEHWWQTWLKPFYVLAAPFDRVLWIDADCVVTGPLEEAFALLDHAPLLVSDRTKAETRNRPRLYRHLAVPEGHDPESVTVNAGVVGLCKIRDRALLDTWCWGIQWAAQQPKLRELVTFADQGILNWAIVRNSLAGVVQTDTRWNSPCKHEGILLLDGHRDSESLLSTIRRLHTGATIVHWYGIYKLPSILVSELSRDFAEQRPHEMNS